MPTVFLCHATEDKPVVGRLAGDLVGAGIPTFYDDWEIRLGESLRRRIDAGIADCTHFVVVLSAVSLTKDWVNLELDAGLVRRIEGGCRLIPIRLGLRVDELPPLLKGMLSVSLDDYDIGVKTLVADIYDVVKRPPLGPIPGYARPVPAPAIGLSTTAGRIAAHIIASSKKGREGDPTIEHDELRAIAGVSDDDLLEAIDELESRRWVEHVRTLASFGHLRAKPPIFAALDAQFMDWNPGDDAKIVAAELTDAPGGLNVSLLAERLAWPPRRMNPALAALTELGAVDSSKIIDRNYLYNSIRKNVQTRRFVRGD